jgi:hypothetical protein
MSVTPSSSKSELWAFIEEQHAESIRLKQALVKERERGREREAVLAAAKGGARPPEKTTEDSDGASSPRVTSSSRSTCAGCAAAATELAAVREELESTRRSLSVATARAASSDAATASLRARLVRATNAAQEAEQLLAHPPPTISRSLAELRDPSSLAASLETMTPAARAPVLAALRLREDLLAALDEEHMLREKQVDILKAEIRRLMDKERQKGTEEGDSG